MIAGLLLGLAASLHCVGMCGPLLLALPGDMDGRQQALVYHAGRISTYMVLGLLFGLAGKGMGLLGWQQALSIAAGVVMLIIAFTAWRFEQMVSALPGFNQLIQRVQRAMGPLLQRQGTEAAFAVGALNGLLPCGMTYAALAGAISTVGGPEGSLFMGMFGLGTLPMLLAAHWMGSGVKTVVRQKMRVLQPVLLLAAGLLLLQRGFAIDLSLFNAAVPRATFQCH
jgi:uncharacterized protein